MTTPSGDVAFGSDITTQQVWSSSLEQFPYEKLIDELSKHLIASLQLES